MEKLYANLRRSFSRLPSGKGDPTPSETDTVIAETGLSTTYDADPGNLFKWSIPALPSLGEPPRLHMIAGSIKVWTSN